MDVWKHGRYVDLWSVVHVLSGALLAFACYWLGYGFWSAVLISLILLAAWEAFELFAHIIEPSPNVTADLVIGALGFMLAAYWHYVLGNPFNVVVFGACLIATVGISIWGFVDFRLRGYR